jgi:RHS repeat-associated protein
LGLYRFGFNGKENDNEVKGVGNQQDYGFRIFDPRLGKFLSVDPLTKDYPWYTPYQFAGNTPIQAIDLDGLEEWKVNGGKDLVNGPYANEQAAQKAVDEGRAKPHSPTIKKLSQEKKSAVGESINILHTAWKIITYDPLQPVAAQPEATSPIGQMVEMTAPYIPVERIFGPVAAKLLPKASAPIIKGVGEYLGLMKPVDEYDVVKTLFRGTTGKEVG